MDKPPDMPEVDFTKLPAGTLLETRNLPKTGKPWQQVKLPVDVVLLTVEDCEFLSCVSHLNPGYYRSYEPILGVVYFGEMGEHQTLKIAVVRCFSGSSRPGGSAIVAQNAVEVLRPKAVFCVGFCGGLKEKFSLGDVVISAKLKTYSSVTVTDNGIYEDGFAVPLERNLLNLIKHADDGWKAPMNGSGDRVKVRKNGVYLSGPEKVESVKRRDELVKRFPDADAIETEGEGLFAAAHNLKMEWVVVKGVSNFADGREPNRDFWRQFASIMAASLTANILNNPIVFKDWPHYSAK